MLLALIGVVFVLTQGSFTAIQNLSFSKGDFYILLGNICWALYGVLGRKFIKTGNPIQTTTYTMTIGALAFMIISSTQKKYSNSFRNSFVGMGSDSLYGNWNECAWLLMVE
ncbi:EamA family transporter [Bacillus paranthracis]